MRWIRRRQAGSATEEEKEPMVGHSLDNSICGHTVSERCSRATDQSTQTEADNTAATLALFSSTISCDTAETQVAHHLVQEDEAQSSGTLQEPGLLEEFFHSRQCGEKKQHRCRFCSHTARRRDHMAQHEMTHTGERPYKCRFCSSAFRERHHAVRHERLHTGERPYKCPFCSFAATQGSSLVRHKRMHTGEKPYKCRFCSYSAPRKGFITAHERMHVGEKPYKCELRPYVAEQAAHLEMQT